MKGKKRKNPVEKTGSVGPHGAIPADSQAPMSPAPKGHAPRAFDLTCQEGIEEALVHWDELAPVQLEWLARDPVQSTRLDLLRRAEVWLDRASAARSTPATTDFCPSAEDLYDYGRGPGYRSMTRKRRSGIEDHLSRCEDCSHAIGSLASPPPVPIELSHAWPLIEKKGDQEADQELEQAHPTVLEPARRRRALPTLRMLVPLGAAAAVLVVGLTWRTVFSAGDAGALQFPPPPLLRGELVEALLFPRDRVLAAPGDSSTWYGNDSAWSNRPRLEIAAQSAASEYRIELRSHAGGAFEEGVPLLRVEGPGPIFEIDPLRTLDLAGRQLMLGAGHYTWEAWVVVNGLDRPLGSRDFQIVEDADLRTALAGLEPESEPGRGMSALRLLHEAGFLTDARSFARQLPPSAERDEYLRRTPGR